MSSPALPSPAESERDRDDRCARLVALGEPGVAGLMGMLSDRSWSVRRAVVAGLAAVGDAAVGPLCAWLRAERLTERGIAAAVDALVASRGAGTEAAVIDLLASPLAEVVADAAQILGRRGATLAADQLGRLLEHPDDNVAVSGIEALGRLGGVAALAPLIQAAHSGNFFRTFAAIGVLGSSGDPGALAPLASLLQDSRYVGEAARALGQSGDRGAIPLLAALLVQPAESLVRVAVVALTDLMERHQLRFGASALFDQTLRDAVSPFAHRLAQSLRLADTTERAAICALFGRLDDPALIPALVTLLASDPGSAESAARALDGLAHQSDAAIRQVLLTADSAHRAALLPLLTVPEGVLGELLLDPEAEVRALSCEAAARSGDKSVVARLFALLSDPQARVAQAALTALQRLGGNQLESLALEAAASPHLGVRRAALRILTAFGFSSAYEVFRTNLSDPDERLRELATYGLAFVAHPDAGATLRQQAVAAAPRIRVAAMRGLGNLPAAPVNSELLRTGLADPDSWVRYYACQALGRLGCEAAAEDIAARLHDEAGQVRIAALEALAQLRSEAAWTLLGGAAATDDPDLRRAALVGFGLSGRAAAIPLLIAAARAGETATRLVALAGLARFTTPESIHELASAGEAEDEQVRSAAVSFLAEMDSPEADRFLVELAARVEVRHPAHAALSAGPRSRTGSVLVGLRTADKGAAAALTAALVRMKSPAADAALVEALSLPSTTARKAAAWALAEVGSGEGMAALARASAQDPDAEVRRFCGALLTRG